MANQGCLYNMEILYTYATIYKHMLFDENIKDVTVHRLPLNVSSSKVTI